MYRLNINMRLSMGHYNLEATEFANWILQIGNGTVPTLPPQHDLEEDWIQLLEPLLLPVDMRTKKNLIEFVYPDLMNNFSNPIYFKQRVILAPKNEDVDEINDAILETMPGPTKEYLNAESIVNIQETNVDANVLFPVEFLNSLKMGSIAHHRLVLKKGTPIMLLHNLNVSAGLCNGTILIVKELGQGVLEAEIIIGTHVGDRVFIPRIFNDTVKHNPSIYNPSMLVSRPRSFCDDYQQESRPKLRTSGSVSAKPGVHSWAIVCSCVTGYFQRRSQDLTRS